MSISRNRSAAALGALCIVAVVACDEPAPPDPTQIVVARLDGEPLYRAEVLQYLEANLLTGEADEAGPDDESLRVKSRLFDAFVDERLLLAEAQRRGLRVSDREVEAYLAAGGEQVVTTESGWEQARRRLLIEKLEEGLVASMPPVADEEVRSRVEGRRQAPEPRRLRLRALMLESTEEAERVYEQIRRRRMTFDEAVVAHETTPGQGVPLEVGWDNLWEEQQRALEKLKPGQVSRPVDINGQPYLFQLQEWIEPESVVDPLSLAQARLELERLQGQRALRQLLQELRERTEILMNLRELPFEYVPER